MYFSEKNLPKGRGSSQQSKAVCCSRKKESSTYFLLIFFQKEEKKVGSRLFQRNGSNSIRTKKQTGSVQAFQDWRTKQSRQQKNSWISQKTVHMVEVASEYSEKTHSASQYGKKVQNYFFWTTEDTQMK